MRTVAWRAAVGGLLLAAAIVAFRGRVGREMPDFEVYRVAGARVLDGESLYRAEDGHWLFKYLPAYALAVAPFALLPTTAARALWFGVSVALLGVLLRESWRLLPGRRRAAAFVVGLTVVALGKFYARELMLGQSNALLALLVVLAVGQWRPARPVAAGALLAAATLVKPYAILFAPYLAVRREWRSALSLGAGIVVILLLPAVRYGFAGNTALLAGWWDTVTTSTAPNLVGQDNISIAAMYVKAVGAGGMAASLALVTAVVVAATAGTVLWRRPISTSNPEYLDAAVLLMLIPLLSPQGWDYVLLVSTPGVMLLLDRIGETRWPWRVLTVACLVLLGLTTYDLLGRTAYRVFMMSPAPTMAALTLVVLLLRLRLRHEA